MRTDSSSTHSSLLEAIKSGQSVRWQEFFDRYRPLIARAARRLGLNPAETDDTVQDVMSELFAGRDNFVYDRKKGRFRAYLYTLTVRRALKVLRKRLATDLEKSEVGHTDSQRQHWEAEYNRHLLREAVDKVRHEFEPLTFQAFELFGLSPTPRPADEVARFLGISVNSVYIAKSRVLARLKAVVRELEEE